MSPSNAAVGIVPVISRYSFARASSNRVTACRFVFQSCKTPMETPRAVTIGAIFVSQSEKTKEVLVNSVITREFAQWKHQCLEIGHRHVTQPTLGPPWKRQLSILAP